MWGLSPVWVRLWTVRALAWMKLLPHWGQSQCHLRSLLWIRSCRSKSARRVKPFVLAQPGEEQ